MEFRELVSFARCRMRRPCFRTRKIQSVSFKGEVESERTECGFASNDGRFSMSVSASYASEVAG